MALALNNLKRVDMPLNKETKPNHEQLARLNIMLLTNYSLADHIHIVIYKALCFDVAQGQRSYTYSNLQSSLLRCGTRPNEWGAQ